MTSAATGRPSGDDFAALRIRLEASLKTIEESLAEHEGRRRATASQREEKDERRAKAARTGALGPEWAAVQRRIDLGQTTLARVFTGEDQSAEARALLERSRATLSQARTEVEVQDAEQGSPDEDPLAEVQALNRAFRARITAMRDLGFGKEEGRR